MISVMLVCCNICVGVMIELSDLLLEIIMVIFGFVVCVKSVVVVYFNVFFVIGVFFMYGI